jgi:TRAP-type mannitol/chloroaromatic compound transport system substrate-binding protein
MDLANNINYTELYNDARTDNNRYVHNLLFGEQNIYEQLSPDAKLVLDKATELVRLSMNMRSHFADDHNHLNSWDAGYAQLKLVWKEYFPNEFKEFRQLYKNLEDRMRPLVYELGFLLK